MSDQWFYSTDTSQVHGPISADRVRELLASGELKPETEIWADNADRSQASEVRKAGELAAAAPPAGMPDWLSDIRRAEEESQTAQKGAELDWLADVEIPVAPLPGELPPAPATPPPPAFQPPASSQSLPSVEVVPVAPQECKPDRFDTGGATSRGLVRPRNEDCFLVQHLTWSTGEERHDVALLLVADGMGGHQAGDKASSLAVRSLATSLAPALSGMLHGPNREAGATVLGRHLDQALQDAHTAVVRRAESEWSCRGMGATAAVAIVWNDLALIRHVGDCRVYHLHGGHLVQVTQDQTLVNRMVQLGKLTPEEAANHPARSHVTQALGQTPSRGQGPQVAQAGAKVAEVDVAESFRKLEPSQHRLRFDSGDRLVLACDGLSAHVDHAALEEAVAEWKGTAQGLAQHLVELANAGGGSDNCTVVVVARD